MVMVGVAVEMVVIIVVLFIVIFMVVVILELLLSAVGQQGGWLSSRLVFMMTVHQSSCTSQIGASA